MAETPVSKHEELVEQITGIGRLMRGDTVLREVTYRIRVYQTFRQASRDAQPTSGLQHVQGDISFSDAARRVDIEGQDLTLRLDDGRRLNLQVGPGGRIYTREVLY
jgi:DNA-binding response OmpR family regulator